MALTASAVSRSDMADVSELRWVAWIPPREKVHPWDVTSAWLYTDMQMRILVTLSCSPRHARPHTHCLAISFQQTPATLSMGQVILHFCGVDHRSLGILSVIPPAPDQPWFVLGKVASQGGLRRPARPKPTFSRTMTDMADISRLASISVSWLLQS